MGRCLTNILYARWTSLALFAAICAGCQSGTPTVSNRALIAHLPGINFSGMSPMQEIDSVQVSCSVPTEWITLPPEDHGLYTVQQWKSPARYAGAGVVHARLPIPVDARMLLWLAKLEYSKSTSAGGKGLAEWTDSLGRPWFEAENYKYHVRGYAVTSGFDAWIVYYGYNLTRPMSPSDLNLAARCVDTVIPNMPSTDASIAPANKNQKAH